MLGSGQAGRRIAALLLLYPALNANYEAMLAPVEEKILVSACVRFRHITKKTPTIGRGLFLLFKICQFYSNVMYSVNNVENFIWLWRLPYLLINLYQRFPNALSLDAAFPL
jgi:hypothetical protein